jgi:hypothetical protein
MSIKIQRPRWKIAKAVLVVLIGGCAPRQTVADAVAPSARPRCTGDAELRVVNRSNALLELVEYDSTTKTTKVISVVDPGVSHFPARGDPEVTYALRRLDATRRSWVASDRTDESGQRSAFAVERRCRGGRPQL